MSSTEACPRRRPQGSHWESPQSRSPASVPQSKASYSMLKSRTKWSRDCISDGSGSRELSTGLAPEESPDFSRTQWPAALRGYHDDEQLTDCQCVREDANAKDFTHSREQPSKTPSTRRTRNEEATWPSARSRRANTRWRIYMRQLVFFLCILLLTLCNNAKSECAVGIKTPGETWPHGDIVLEYGKSLRILCILNKTFVDLEFPGKNSSDLEFFRNKKLMEKEYITVINETTIELFIEKPPPAEDMYYCKLRLNDNRLNNDSHNNTKQYEAVCLNKVVIGFKPQAPKSFDCISYNWEKLVCSWDPVENYAKTKFFLSFKLAGIAGRRAHRCPLSAQHLLEYNQCFWNTSTDPFYRQPYDVYQFFLYAENGLGNDTFTYKFNNFANVIPDKAENLEVINKTSESAYLHWNLPFPMQTFPPGLHYKILYQNQFDLTNEWKRINITDKAKEHTIYYNLTGLEYANVVYDVRVYMKSAVANTTDRWSDFSDVTFRTLPKEPGTSPQSDMGSFEIVENSGNRDVYIYWQIIPVTQENGDNFRYVVTHVEENGRQLMLRPNETTKTYAKFKGISFNSYKFEVKAANIIGEHKNSAKYYVPSRFEMPPEPIAFTKIAFDGGLYELSWKPPITNKKIINYTIFWCNNDRDRPYQCTGYFDWIHVPSNITMYNMTVPDEHKVYQFAISANTKTASSGMVWASCTVIHNKVVGKMKSAWINRIGSDFIEVGWKLECSDRIGIVEGFNIYYCPIVSPYNLNCKGPKLNVTIKADPQTIHGMVHGLKPYTTYMLAVAVLTKTGEGLHSDPLYNTTLEAAPSSPPRNITVSNVTNSTILVSWQEPEAMNGVLRYYEVYYNEKSQKVEEINQVVLQGLLAHRNYSIRVAACTVSCSVKSSPVYMLTDIGWPGEIELPSVHFVNSSQVEVSWKSPEYAAGHLDYYQIINSHNEIQNSTATEAQLPIPDCQTVGREAIYQFRVRAVNIARDQTHLPGPWSSAGEGNCYGGGPSNEVLVFIWVLCCVFAFAFFVAVSFCFKRMWIKCNYMRNIDVKLPPGLAQDTTLLQKPGDQHARQSSADSSGCSSGQESVTSSLTSESHVSNDSGADVDPVSTSNKLLVEAAPAWEATSLRQRNVAITKPSGTVDAARWEPYVKITKAGETALSDRLSLARSSPNLTDATNFAGSPQTWLSTVTSVHVPVGYMSMPSSEEMSSSPSPVPKEAAHLAAYSMVGIMPKPLRPKSEELNSLMIAVVSVPPQSAQDAKTPYPYVTQNALEQKTLTLSELNFPEAFSSADKVSRPYVQASLMESFKKGVTATESCKKPFVSTFGGPAPLSKDTTSKPYITIAAISDDVKPSVKMESLESKSKPYLPAPSVFQMLQQQQQQSPQKTAKSEVTEAEDTEPLYWPSTGSEDSGSSSLEDEGTSGKLELRGKDDPTIEDSLKTSLQFPQNPRFGKNSNSQADEQYSKVTVVNTAVK